MQKYRGKNSGRSIERNHVTLPRDFPGEFITEFLLEFLSELPSISTVIHPWIHPGKIFKISSANKNQTLTSESIHYGTIFRRKPWRTFKVNHWGSTSRNPEISFVRSSRRNFWGKPKRSSGQNPRSSREKFIYYSVTFWEKYRKKSRDISKSSPGGIHDGISSGISLHFYHKLSSNSSTENFAITSGKKSSIYFWNIVGENPST